MKRFTLTAAAAAALLLLAGCAAPSTPTSIAKDDYKGFPTSREDSSGGEGGEPQAFWLDNDRDSFAIVTFGSSTCPGIPTEVKRESDKVIGVTITMEADKPCTADFVPWTFEFETPDDIADSGTVEAKIFLNWGDTSTVTVQIQD